MQFKHAITVQRLKYYVGEIWEGRAVFLYLSTVTMWLLWLGILSLLTADSQRAKDNLVCGSWMNKAIFASSENDILRNWNWRLRRESKALSCESCLCKRPPSWLRSHCGAKCFLFICEDPSRSSAEAEHSSVCLQGHCWGGGDGTVLGLDDQPV